MCEPLRRTVSRGIDTKESETGKKPRSNSKIKNTSTTMASLAPPTKNERKSDRRSLLELGLDPTAVNHAAYSPYIHCALFAHPVLSRDEFMVAVGFLATRGTEGARCHDPEKGAMAIQEWGRFRDIQLSTQRWREAAQRLASLEQKHRRGRNGTIHKPSQHHVLYAV